MTASEQRIEEILAYWFGDATRSSRELAEFWFLPNPETDREIAARFGDDVRRAARGDSQHWQESPRGRLALIVLLDQFSRNIHRGTPLAFAQDARALELCLSGLQRQHDFCLGPLERGVLYVPLEHAENLDMQNRSVRCYEGLLAAATNETETTAARRFLDYACAHRDVIRRFSRFPHRNEILDRPSTPEELSFLKQPGSSFAS